MRLCKKDKENVNGLFIRSSLILADHEFKTTTKNMVPKEIETNLITILHV